MSVFFARQGKAPSKSALVTITGTGNSSRCYVIIGGVKYSTSASGIEAMSGDVITFGVYGRASGNYGEVRIDGTQVLEVTDTTTKTYDWTVPDGVTEISITLTSFSYNVSNISIYYYGRITVTTS